MLHNRKKRKVLFNNSTDDTEQNNKENDVSLPVCSPNLPTQAEDFTAQCIVDTEPQTESTSANIPEAIDVDI